MRFTFLLDEKRFVMADTGDEAMLARMLRLRKGGMPEDAGDKALARHIAQDEEMAAFLDRMIRFDERNAGTNGHFPGARKFC